MSMPKISSVAHCTLLHRKVWKSYKTSMVNIFRNFTKIKKRPFVLGIETSCDETGAAVVDANGVVLGEAINSQLQTHIDLGGVIPPVAKLLHRQYIDKVVKKAVENSELTLNDLDAVATTVKPGLELCLLVGLQYTRQLLKECRKPFIPVHHMEAHALTVRMMETVPFPFLVLLISGGHCQIAVAKSVSEFLLLGSTLDDAPGEAMDKLARRLKLRNLNKCSALGGGQAVELMAELGNPTSYPFCIPLSKYRDCNFSFSGLKQMAIREVQRAESLHSIEADGIIPNVADLCAAFQHAITHHLVKRLHRAMIFCELKNLLPSNNKTLVVSGGVASNQYIRGALSFLCDVYSYDLKCPPPKLCSDNGAMIAWNGVERWHTEGSSVAQDPDSVDIQAKCPLGKDISAQVREAHIKLPTLKLDVDKIRMYSTSSSNCKNS